MHCQNATADATPAPPSCPAPRCASPSIEFFACRGAAGRARAGALVSEQASEVAQCQSRKSSTGYVASQETHPEGRRAPQAPTAGEGQGAAG